MIPSPLRDKRYRFSPAKGKRPLLPKWNSKNNFEYDDPALLEVDNNPNYIVCCGYGDLLVVDIDSKEIAPALMRALFNTFTVKTGSGGFHLYYEVDDATSTFFDKDKKRLVDVQGKGKGVIGPGSIHPNGNTYEVHDGRKIMKVKRQYLLDVIAKVCAIPKKAVPPPRKRHKVNKRFSISQILRAKGINPYVGVQTADGFLTDTPFGNSTGKKCFHFNDSKGIWYCFHTQQGGTAYNLLELMRNG